jgi:hypothetical protein
MKIRSALVAAALVGAGVLVGGAPAHAQQAATISGSAVCDETSGEYVVTWVIEQFVGTPGEVINSSVSGVDVVGVIVFWSPNPFAFDDQFIVGTMTIPGDTAGTVSVNVLVQFQSKGTFEWEGFAEVELDGSCQARETPTTLGTTTTAARPAQGAQPRFTG